MLAGLWTKFMMMVLAFRVRHQCRAYIRQAGYLHEPSSDGWTCYQCDERLDEVQLEKIVHTQAGETIKHPMLVATMCARCAWIADGSMKIPIWKWLLLKEKGTHSRDFFLGIEKASLKLRLSQIDQELNRKKTLVFVDPLFQKHVRTIHGFEEDPDEDRSQKV